MAVVSSEENERWIEEFSFMGTSVVHTALPMLTNRGGGLVAGEIAEIPLTKGRVAIVDAADYEWLREFRWCANVSIPGYVYAVRTPKSGRIRMHRQILGLTPDQDVVVDHINRNTLDNRRANLRVCQQQQNSYNRCGSTNSASGFKGVSVVGGPFWSVSIVVNSKKVHLWCGTDPVVGAAIYNHFARLAYGEFAYLNDLGEQERALVASVAPERMARALTKFQKAKYGDA